MGEESSWFNFLPGLPHLVRWAENYLGRTPSGKMHFVLGPLNESHFTLTHVLTLLLIILMLTLVGLAFRYSVQKSMGKSIVPSEKVSMSNIIEVFFDFVLQTMSGIMGEKKAKQFFPFIATFSVLILCSNLISLIPGFLSPTAFLKTNLAFALCVFFVTHYQGAKEQGAWKYFKHFLGPFPFIFPLNIAFLIIELISHCIRPFALGLRLTGNISADHKVIGLFAVLMPLLVPLPLFALGTLVALVQTFVFCLLSVLYIHMAIDHGDPDDNEHTNHH